MGETSDEIIILSDDEDDVQIESIISSSKTRSHKPILILTEPKSLTYGLERGYKLKRIHGIKKCPTNNQLMYLIEYDRCDDYEFVPANILHKYCDKNLLIQFLENLTEFCN